MVVELQLRDGGDTMVVKKGVTPAAAVRTLSSHNYLHRHMRSLWQRLQWFIESGLVGWFGCMLQGSGELLGHVDSLTSVGGVVLVVGTFFFGTKQAFLTMNMVSQRHGWCL